MKKKVLICYDDPGGGLAVSSLIPELRKNKSLELKIYSGKLSIKISEKINTVRIDSFISREKAKMIIDKFLPDLILTGTGGGNTEQALRNEAYKRDIKSIVVLDSWKDYSRRWLYSSYDLKDMKDKICVMDELTKKEMITDNFSKENLIVTGQPYLNKIFNKDKNILKKSFLKNQILFLSQPLKIIGINDYKVHPFEVLMNAIRQLADIKEEKFKLTIKLHPSENLSDELREIVRKNNSDKVEVKFAGKGITLKELIKDSETVIGYNTIALFEAKAMNRRTISLNVVPVNKSLTASMEKAGIEIVKSGEKIILNSLLKEKQSVKKANLFKGGIANCVSLILKELSLN